MPSRLFSVTSCWSNFHIPSSSRNLFFRRPNTLRSKILVMMLLYLIICPISWIFLFHLSSASSPRLCLSTPGFVLLSVQLVAVTFLLLQCDFLLTFSKYSFYLPTTRISNECLCKGFPVSYPDVVVWLKYFSVLWMIVLLEVLFSFFVSEICGDHTSEIAKLHESFNCDTTDLCIGRDIFRILSYYLSNPILLSP